MRVEINRERSPDRERTKAMWCADDGNCDLEYPYADSGLEAAQEYVDDGDWGDDLKKTTWVHVWAWEVDDESGEEIEGTCELHRIAIEPEEPKCSDGDHAWTRQGGCDENPGVWGHGGGVYVVETCEKCGCRRTTDTWAQDPSTGEQGLTSIEYETCDEWPSLAERLADECDESTGWDWSDGSDHEPSDRLAVVEHHGRWYLAYRGTEADEAIEYPDYDAAEAAFQDQVYQITQSFDDEDEDEDE